MEEIGCFFEYWNAPNTDLIGLMAEVTPMSRDTFDWAFQIRENMEKTHSEVLINLIVNL